MCVAIGAEDGAGLEADESAVSSDIHIVTVEARLVSAKG